MGDSGTDICILPDSAACCCFGRADGEARLLMCVVVGCTRVNNGCKGWVTVELTYVFYRIMRLVVVLVGLTVKLGCGYASIGQGMGHFASLDLWRVMAAV